MIRKTLKKLFFGKKVYQSFFRRIFLISLDGMNIGTAGQRLEDSGEMFVIHYVLGKEIEPVVFDVGAQGGHYLKEVIKTINGKGDIYAFEPCMRDYQPLEEIFGKRATIIRKALGDYNGIGILYYPDNVRGVASLHIGTKKFVTSENVKVQTIDSFCQEQGIEKITLLKLDVEGNELACLRGAIEMLSKIKYIQFEISISSRDSRTYFRDIFDFLSDYKIYRILKDGLWQIEGPDKINELLFTTNYLAIRK